MSAAIEASNQASLDFTDIDCDRAGVCFGSSLAGFMETVSHILHARNRILSFI